MSHVSETKGIVLMVRNYREKDKLIKIFTERYGKMMFFVKNAHRPNNGLAAAILPYTEAEYIASIKNEGLSFLNSSKSVHSFTQIQGDIFISAYATYILNLVDAAIEDRYYDPFLYTFTQQALVSLNEGKDPEIITNIFEIQIMQRFGVALNWEKCAICGCTQGKFDFSSKYHGVICEQHFHMDERRQHCDARALHFIRLFSNISYDRIQDIKVKEQTKGQIRLEIDRLYEEFVGIHLKSKSFIDKMKNWEQTLKIPDR